jgi:anti-sigma factor RsiW
MTCRRIETQLDDYLDGALDSGARAAVEQHAADCIDCGSLLERATALKGIVAALPVDGPDPDFFDEALRQAALQSEQAKPRPIARGWYAGAIAAGLATIAIVGMLVNGTDTAPPAQGLPAGVAQVAMAVEESRTINLVFASEEALESVSLTVELPEGVELANYPGKDRVLWSTRLQAGKNVLPLELVALGGTGGELVATMRRDGKEKVFRVNIAVLMG